MDYSKEIPQIIVTKCDDVTSVVEQLNSISIVQETERELVWTSNQSTNPLPEKNVEDIPPVQEEEIVRCPVGSTKKSKLTNGHHESVAMDIAKKVKPKPRVSVIKKGGPATRIINARKGGRAKAREMKAQESQMKVGEGGKRESTLASQGGGSGKEKQNKELETTAMSKENGVGVPPKVSGTGIKTKQKRITGTTTKQTTGSSSVHSKTKEKCSASTDHVEERAHRPVPSATVKIKPRKIYVGTAPGTRLIATITRPAVTRRGPHIYPKPRPFVTTSSITQRTAKPTPLPVKPKPARMYEGFSKKAFALPQEPSGPPKNRISKAAQRYLSLTGSDHPRDHPPKEMPLPAKCPIPTVQKGNRKGLSAKLYYGTTYGPSGRRLSAKCSVKMSRLPHMSNAARAQTLLNKKPVLQRLKGRSDEASSSGSGKFFGLMREAQSKHLDKLNRVYLNDDRYADVVNLSGKLEQYKVLFLEADEDNSGDIDLLELKRLMEKLGSPKTHFELKKMIAEVDTSNSGTINYAEFLQMMLGKRNAIFKRVLMFEADRQFREESRRPPPKRDLKSLP